MLNNKINSVKIQFTYDRNSEKKFKENIQKDKNLELLAKLVNQPELNQNKIDNSISCLNELILNAAKKSFPCKKMPNKNENKKPKQHKTKKWFNKECSKYRKVLRKYSRDLSSSPFDKNKLHIFTKARMNYKRVQKSRETT